MKRMLISFCVAALLFTGCGEKEQQPVSAGCDHHPSVIGLDYAFTAQGVGFCGRLASVVHYLGEIEAVHRRIISTNILRIRTSVHSVPIASIHQVVVMSKHPRLSLNSPQLRVGWWSQPALT